MDADWGYPYFIDFLDRVLGDPGTAKPVVTNPGITAAIGVN